MKSGSEKQRNLEYVYCVRRMKRKTELGLFYFNLERELRKTERLILKKLKELEV